MGRKEMMTANFMARRECGWRTIKGKGEGV
jgi:hypothetical protein